MRAGFLAVIFLLPALAAAETGNDLRQDCSVALKHFNNKNVAQEPADSIKTGNCIGFVNGVMQAAALKKAVPANDQSKEPVKESCTRADVSVEQVVRMSLDRLKRKPEELDVDAAEVILRALNEGAAIEPCLGGPAKPVEGLQWPDFPKKSRMRVRVVAIAVDLPRSYFSSNLQVLVAEREIDHDEFSLIKLVFTFLPYQPRLSEAGFNYSVVHEVLAWRNPECDETVAQLTARSMPDRHEPLIYSSNVPREDLELKHIPLPCYEARADDYIKSSLEPVPPPPVESAQRRKLVLPPQPPEPAVQGPNPR
jgi:hypothetical protein